MVKAQRIHQPGGPEAMSWDDIDVRPPGPGEVLLRQTAVGLNYIDTYQRSGLYPLPELPAVIGMEGAGVVEAVGPAVNHVKAGDRVAYCMEVGAYAEQRLIDAGRLVVLPDAITDQQAASMMLKGLTAHYLLHTTYPVKRGEIILVHAAAGGVGLILCQWAKHLGVNVIGTVGSEAKAKLAKAYGCDYPIVYTSENFVEQVKDFSGSQGVRVVYDSVGKDTFEGSLDCLRPRGLFVTFGQSSGKIAPFDTGILAAKGSLFVTRPGLATHIAARADLEARARDLFEVVGDGAVKIEVRQTYALGDAVQAHRDLEGRRTTGSTVLLP
jgi:NADPH2:quinone reductase